MSEDKIIISFDDEKPAHKDEKIIIDVGEPEKIITENRKTIPEINLNNLKLNSFFKDNCSLCSFSTSQMTFPSGVENGFGDNFSIDLKDVFLRVQDDKELLAELFDIYLEDFVVKRQALADAIAAHDIAKVKEVAHSMKGSSGNISAKPMYAACLQLEVLAKEGKTDGMLEVLTSIDSYFERIKIFAAGFKKDLKG